MKPVEDLQRRSWGEVRYPNVYYLGWLNDCMLLCEGVKAAVKKVGAENLDGAAIISATESLGDVDLGCVPKFNMSPGKRHGSDLMRVIQIKGGKVVPISDWIGMPDLLPKK